MIIPVVVLLAITALSITVHELGHVLAGQRVGWGFAGIRIHPLGGVIVRMRMADPDDLWLVALAGLAATAMLASGFWIVEPLIGTYATFGWVLNAALFGINAIPLGPTDGRAVMRGIVG